MSRVPFPQNATRSKEESDSQTQAVTIESHAKEESQPTAVEESNSIAARFSLQVGEAICEQTAKAFEEQADNLERSFGSDDLEPIIAGILHGVESIIRQHVAEQLPKVVARQAGSLREVARALRSSPG